jgi:CRP/FNR family transcriptional regulator, cyclic AMP receptor protein
MEECVITSLTKELMIALLHTEPKFSEMFMAYLLTRNSRVEEDLIDQLFNSSEKRLARLLLLLAHFGKESSPQPINPSISQETLAEMIGTTRSRVSYFMNKFRKLLERRAQWHCRCSDHGGPDGGRYAPFGDGSFQRPAMDGLAQR